MFQCQRFMDTNNRALPQILAAFRMVYITKSMTWVYSYRAYSLIGFEIPRYDVENGICWLHDN